MLQSGREDKEWSLHILNMKKTKEENVELIRNKVKNWIKSPPTFIKNSSLLLLTTTENKRGTTTTESCARLDYETEIRNGWELYGLGKLWRKEAFLGNAPLHPSKEHNNLSFIIFCAPTNNNKNIIRKDIMMMRQRTTIKQKDFFSTSTFTLYSPLSSCLVFSDRKMDV